MVKGNEPKLFVKSRIIASKQIIGTKSSSCAKCTLFKYFGHKVVFHARIGLLTPPVASTPANVLGSIAKDTF